jgi:hypothetical protein
MIAGQVRQYSRGLFVLIDLLNRGPHTARERDTTRGEDDHDAGDAERGDCEAPDQDPRATRQATRS